MRRVVVLIALLAFVACGKSEEKDTNVTTESSSDRESKGIPENQLDSSPEPDEVAEDEDLLVGLWQDVPAMASGWSSTYQFFSDGTFVLNESQMDCAKRLVWSKGTWKRIGKDELELMITEWQKLEGGRMIPSDGSCGSDSMLVGATEKNIPLEVPKPITLQLGSIIFAGDDHPDRTTVEIGNVKFYRFSDDPAAYP
ncbi:MAG: hypothetical protein KDD67_09415 [Ignavibacteriae bacterium]|nr:hypothetical protein [Ignavibacteriota bacterium]MCB9216438.1 hypothetical protein [Ignavibacteria bacterium]